MLLELEWLACPSLVAEVHWRAAGQRAVRQRAGERGGGRGRRKRRRGAGGASGASGTSGAGGASGGGASGAGGAVDSGLYPSPEPCTDPTRKTCGAAKCVKPSPADGCSLVTCVDCPSVDNGVQTCSATRCAFACNTGFHATSTACVPDSVGTTDAGLDAGPPPTGSPDGDACSSGTTCRSGVCKTGKCAAARCDDGVKNGRETDKDCGGNCVPCAMGGKCSLDGDCSDGPCTAGVCACTPYLCSNPAIVGKCGDVPNNCGGTVACGCGSGTTCYQNSCCDPQAVCKTACGTVPDGCGGNIDCGTNNCLSGETCYQKKCCLKKTTCPAGVCGSIDDGCGGPLDCGLTTCTGGTDVCVTGKCCTPATKCAANACDTADDGCGKKITCAACPAGLTCGFTTAGQCGSQCTDTTLNGNETDVDCGGGTCAKCADQKKCNGGADCTNGVCSCTGLFCQNSCQAPSCTDGVKNGTEPAIDCGGSCARKCGATLPCSGNADCASGTCTGNVCTTPAHCTNGSKDSDETDVNCGGSCAPCPATRTCTAAADCQSGNCSCSGLFCTKRCQ